MQADVAPKVQDSAASSAQTSQVLSVGTGAANQEKLTPGQAAWLRFVDRVERGKQIDLSGQYVAKSTKVAPAEAGSQILRPKADAAKPDFAKHYKRLADGEWVGIAPDDATSNNTGENDCNECIDVPAPGGGPGAEFATFISSVGQGGTGPIFDIKVMYNNPSPSATILNYAGYIMLNADLNKGSGGDYIYFTFTRNAAQALYGPGDPSGPTVGTRAFQTKTEGRFTTGPVPLPPTNFLNIWTPTSSDYVNPDLNGRAGGKYIWSYQSKNPSIYPVRFAEVGVLSSNSSTAMPPAGWEKFPQDLNEGCGGDYIYFCYRY